MLKLQGNTKINQKEYSYVIKKGLHISVSYIKGYQVDAENFQNLARCVQLNVIVDHMGEGRLIEFLAQKNEVNHPICMVKDGHID